MHACTQKTDLFSVYHRIRNQLFNKLITQRALFWLAFSLAVTVEIVSQWRDETNASNKQTNKHFIQMMHNVETLEQGKY